ncbi:Diaminohydroxyphosphoribosylaminopyrimidine deaminase / 5-amino-6-(5-phosphoribosylamino)uracil reductase [hydrothermal vent metagenome]|uniref:Diaminohydroxyphosphoribosylaminopyrimidine deaminase / 5-amino-6-(5-phosphoribosylamino)uracil reductase n=1 Tax=hydrothermal vent metagenome TaxID=652676 RepID=A0A3B0VZ05_9ZZZZ
MSVIEFSPVDQAYMQQALVLAKKGRYSVPPNPAVGCVLVKNDHVVGAGWHQRAGEPHAEQHALTQAQQQALGATAYVTLEPCSHFGRTAPCADALIEGGVKKVCIAMLDPNPLVSGQGVQRLEQAGIEVVVGMLEAEAQALNVGFVRRMEQGLPYVILKIASSLDGRTAMANGESQWITGKESRIEVHKLRAQCGAIVTGIGTVLADDPSLTVRLPEKIRLEMNLDGSSSSENQPLRVVLDPMLQMPSTAKMLRLEGNTLLVTSSITLKHQRERVAKFRELNCDVIGVSCQANRLDLPSVLQYLAKEAHINTVMVESGAMVAGAFLEEGLVDELHTFIAPCLLGDKAKPMFHLPNIHSMANKCQLTMDSMEILGDDIRLILKPIVSCKGS